MFIFIFNMGRSFTMLKPHIWKIDSLLVELYNLQRRGIFVRDDESFSKSLDKVKNFITAA